MESAGDFEKLVARTHSAVRAYIAGLGVPLEAVDDIAQELYLDYYRESGRPTEVEPVRWLKGMARRRCLGYFRRKAREGRRLEALAEVLARALPEGGEPAPAEEALRRCLDKAPPGSQRLIALRYEREMRSEAIARAVGMTAGAVRIALLRIRMDLKACMEQALS